MVISPPDGEAVLFQGTALLLLVELVTIPEPPPDPAEFDSPGSGKVGNGANVPVRDMLMVGTETLLPELITSSEPDLLGSERVGNGTNVPVLDILIVGIVMLPRAEVVPFQLGTTLSLGEIPESVEMETVGNGTDGKGTKVLEDMLILGMVILEFHPANVDVGIITVGLVPLSRLDVEFPGIDHGSEVLDRVIPGSRVSDADSDVTPCEDWVWFTGRVSDDVGRTSEVLFWVREKDAEIGLWLIVEDTEMLLFHESLDCARLSLDVSAVELLESAAGLVVGESVVRPKDDQSDRVSFHDPDVVDSEPPTVPDDLPGRGLPPTDADGTELAVCEAGYVGMTEPSCVVTPDELLDVITASVPVKIHSHYS
ncbi:hypothetical protein F66182_4538 [Fusarium sp. NRRL 66182]|nr:hypothetical protein F66182_4538 [Fusarium sp. NRRL 66182]